jgi:hypothetical protein
MIMNRTQILSLVTFFGPAKKATRLPAGTGGLGGSEVRSQDGKKLKTHPPSPRL